MKEKKTEQHVMKDGICLDYQSGGLITILKFKKICRLWIINGFALTTGKRKNSSIAFCRNTFLAFNVHLILFILAQGENTEYFPLK